MAQRRYYKVEVIERTGFIMPTDDREAITYLINDGIDASSDDEDAKLAQGVAGVDLDADDDELVAICASSTIDNGKPNCRGVCAVHFPAEKKAPRFWSVTRHGTDLTNIRVDYCAALEAIECANELDPDRNKKLVVYTSNQSLIYSMAGKRPVDDWQRNNWKRKGNLVPNHDLLDDLLDGEQTRRPVRIEWRHTKDTTTSTWVLGLYTAAQKEAKKLVRQTQP
ncbi:hypothetical protein BBJ28_00001983 [Nothophytophthora sp. Chile5]|nr:hypothetical protein BBJ28_00001983 [Nothophytophthora sp. Chile5]